MLLLSNKGTSASLVITRNSVSAIAKVVLNEAVPVRCDDYARAEYFKCLVIGARPESGIVYAFIEEGQ